MNSPARFLLRLAAAFALTACVACRSDDPSPEGESERAEVKDEDGDGFAERPELTAAECEERGKVVYDIGDGKTHSVDYRCANGEPPFGRIIVGHEGGVCCPL